MKQELTALLLALALLSALARGQQPRAITAVRTPLPPVLDGQVVDAQWKEAPAALDFTQFSPVEGARPTELTSVRILYDDHALYVGVICYDAKPEAIVRQLTRRDRIGEADRFTIMIDSFNDKQTAFSFTANVSGVQTDGVYSQGGLVYDLSWDAVWKVATRVYQDGWSAEFEIPYGALRFAERDAGSAVWGVNFRRYISRKQESIDWVMVPRTEQLQIPFWGRLQGLAGIRPPVRLELVPYASGSVTYHTAAARQESSPELRGLTGLDVKYGLSPNFTLDATVNPDFGQVEVDQAVLNLTVFETLYPEKRPFFVEGAQFYSFGLAANETPLSIFFSRRVGKSPSGRDFIQPPPQGSIAENPSATTILGAAKLSGRSSSGLAVGAMAAVTDDEFALLRDSTGRTDRIRTEPEGSYNVIRLRQDFPDGSYVGTIATLAARKSTSPAGSGGIDWNVRFAEGTHTIDGYLAAAHSSSGVGSPDGVAGLFKLSRLSAGHWFYNLFYDFYSRRFDINDIGFFARARDHGGSIGVWYNEPAGTAWYHRYTVSFLPDLRWNWDGAMTMARATTQAWWELTNFWLVGGTYVLNLPSTMDEQYGIIGTYRRPLDHSLKVQAQTDSRKDVVFDLGAGYSTDTHGKGAFTGSAGVTIRPASWMELGPTLLYQRVRNEEAGVFSGGSIVSVGTGAGVRSLFADRDVDELDLGLRGIVTFTRNFSLQFYSQVLLAEGTYRNERVLVASDRFLPWGVSAGAYDFTDLTFNANVLLRWEYLPGSAVYLVWTQSRYGGSGGPYGRGFTGLLSDTFMLPHQDVVLLKATYWFSL
jgi:hypothetical protein